MDAELKIEGFDLLRSDRVGRKCGGTAPYLKVDLNGNVTLQYSYSTVEFLTVKLKCMDTIFITINCPPNTQKEDWCNAVDALNKK